MTKPTMRHTVVVRNPRTTAAVALCAGQEVPEWATDLVHADDLAGEKAEPAAEESKPTPKRSAKK